MAKANNALDKTQQLQSKPYMAAEQSPTRRFRAPSPSRSNPRADRAEGRLSSWTSLQPELNEPSLPLPVRQASSQARRRGAFPAVRDRVVQAAVKIIRVRTIRFLRTHYGPVEQRGC